MVLLKTTASQYLKYLFIYCRFPSSKTKKCSKTAKHPCIFLEIGQNMYFNVNFRVFAKIPIVPNIPRFFPISRFCWYKRWFLDFLRLMEIGTMWGNRWKYILKIYYLGFNLSGHTYFYNKWVIIGGNRANMLENEAKIGKIGICSGFLLFLLFTSFSVIVPSFMLLVTFLAIF